MKELLACIEDVRSRLDALRHRTLKEAATRKIVVDPLLQALGWDLRDPDEVEHEFTTVDGRAVDYALKLNRRPVLLVEAKALDDPLDDVKAEAQVVRYAAAEGVVWCILTNGIRWKIYRSIEECSAPEKLMFEVSLDSKDAAGVPVSQLAEQMWRFSREQMARGTLDALGEQMFTDGKIRKALDVLLRDPPRALLKLVRQVSGDDRLGNRRIRESLIRIARAGPAGGPPVPHFPPGTPDAHSVLEVAVGKEGGRRRARRARESESPYDESHHTAGKPQEVLELYRAIERECLGLRPGAVQKRYLAKYIAFEVDRRMFCSVHLQQGGLRVWLYPKLHRLPNPPPFARDVSNVGHWGGGNVELAITSLGQLEEAGRLIRASFQQRCGQSS